MTVSDSIVGKSHSLRCTILANLRDVRCPYQSFVSAGSTSHPCSLRVVCCCRLIRSDSFDSEAWLDRTRGECLERIRLRWCMKNTCHRPCVTTIHWLGCDREFGSERAAELPCDWRCKVRKEWRELARPVRCGSGCGSSSRSPATTLRSVRVVPDRSTVPGIAPVLSARSWRLVQSRSFKY